jgi:hypothetical protein
MLDKILKFSPILIPIASLILILILIFVVSKFKMSKLSLMVLEKADDIIDNYLESHTKAEREELMLVLRDYLFSLVKNMNPILRVPIKLILYSNFFKETPEYLITSLNNYVDKKLDIHKGKEVVEIAKNTAAKIAINTLTDQILKLDVKGNQNISFNDDVVKLNQSMNNDIDSRGFVNAYAKINYDKKLQAEAGIVAGFKF